MSETTQSYSVSKGSHLQENPSGDRGDLIEIEPRWKDKNNLYLNLKEFNFFEICGKPQGKNRLQDDLMLQSDP